MPAFLAHANGVTKRTLCVCVYVCLAFITRICACISCSCIQVYPGTAHTHAAQVRATIHEQQIADVFFPVSYQCAPAILNHTHAGLRFLVLRLAKRVCVSAYHSAPITEKPFHVQISVAFLWVQRATDTESHKPHLTEFLHYVHAGWGVLVSKKPKETAARYTVRDPSEVLTLLQALVSELCCMFI